MYVYIKGMLSISIEILITRIEKVEVMFHKGG
jgi:hypothetical protein